jgi:hypothetical protein
MIELQLLENALPELAGTPMWNWIMSLDASLWFSYQLCCNISGHRFRLSGYFIQPIRRDQNRQLRKYHPDSIFEAFQIYFLENLDGLKIPGFSAVKMFFFSPLLLPFLSSTLHPQVFSSIFQFSSLSTYQILELELCFYPFFEVYRDNSGHEGLLTVAAI